MNLFKVFEGRVSAAILRLVEDGHLPSGLETSRVLVEPPRDPSHGDLATNAALALAKEAKIPPRVLAEKIAVLLLEDDDIVRVEVAGPGFINLVLETRVFHDVLKAALEQGQAFGHSTKGGGEKVNVEYVSANPTGPMHVGHGRGAVFGDALANVLDAAGYAVTREYYINDAGAQVDVLARSTFHRYREALGKPVGDLAEGLYPGDYLKPVAAALVNRFGDSLLDQPEAIWLAPVREVAVAAMMALIRDDLASLGITHDVFFSERSLIHGDAATIPTILKDLRTRGLVYEGRLAPPKGQPIEDWEDREQVLFRATAFGDDVDRPLLKSDGSYTYFASDIAYHASKFLRGFESMIDVWGADHGGYIKRMQSAVAAVTGGQGTLEVKLCQMVRLLREGSPVKMSKRSGSFVTLREVVDEVGRDAVRFMMIFRKNDAPLDFDLASVVEQSKDNPVFYVQYAHARCASVFRQAQEIYPDLDFSSAALETADLSLLIDDAERDLLKIFAQYPRILESAAAAREPHRIAFYVYDLASVFHSLWNKGKGLSHLRFVNGTDASATLARLALVSAVKAVLASSLFILGVTAPDEMR